MIIYLIKSSLCLSAFLLIYYFVFEREKMHTFKRFYLLVSLVFSFVLPLISFEFKGENAIVSASNNIQSVVLPTLEISTKTNYLPTILLSIYGFITLLFAIRFFRNLYTILVAKKNADIIYVEDAELALVNDAILAYTFGSTIFINKQSYDSKLIETELFTHELTHVRQKHTLDVLLIEVLKTVFWFNPLLILYKKAIQLNHEFLGDEKVIHSHANISTYQNLLLSKSMQHTNFYLTSNLTSFLKTKKRFIMMTKTTSKVRETLSQLSILPVLAGLIFISCTEQTSSTDFQEYQTFDKSETIEVTLADNESYPEFPGGINELNKFVSKNYIIPKVKGLSGKLLVGFYIEVDGSVNEITVYKDLGHGTAEEAIRVLKLIPKWKPATVDSKPIRMLFAMPIHISNDIN